MSTEISIRDKLLDNSKKSNVVRLQPLAATELGFRLEQPTMAGKWNGISNECQKRRDAHTHYNYVPTFTVLTNIDTADFGFMKELLFKFDQHGLGDVVHFAHAVQLYLRRGYDVTVQVEPNKRWVWQVAGVNLVDSGELPNHGYEYHPSFEDLNAPDHIANKVAAGLRHAVLPPLEELHLTPEQAWSELCAIRLKAIEHVSPEAHEEADKFIDGLPRPIVAIHTRGTNWHERKSLPTETAFEVILRLLKVTGGSVVVLDFDARAPMVGHERCKGIRPAWGCIGTDRLCALYLRSDLVIGIDSGPFHVASLTDTKALGVFRSLHPNRVCLPNPNAVYLASDQYETHWATRRPLWNIVTYRGSEPSVDEIVDVALSMITDRVGGARVTFNADARAGIAGEYIYHRVGHDARLMSLELTGQIGLGAAGSEQRWSAGSVDERKAINVFGKDGLICSCEWRDDRFVGAWTQFERMPIEFLPARSRMTEHIGLYFCEFIGDCEFEVTLLEDSTVEASNSFDTWGSISDRMWLLRQEQLVVLLSKDSDGCWRGTNMETGQSVEMIAAIRQPFRSFGSTTPIPYREQCYSFTSLDTFNEQCIAFARSLPPIKALSGVPRGGVLAATLMALDLNCPLIPIESLLTGEIPEIPVPRRGRGARFVDDGMIVVIDDNCSSGRVISTIRPRLHPSIKIGVITGNDHADFYGNLIERDVFHTYEWTLLHDDNAEYTLVDLDGVLCDDWMGGSEVSNLDQYHQFLESVLPRRRPSYPLMGIVTNRLERYRSATEQWLRRNGIEYRGLWMSPYATFEERDAAGDSAIRKARVYSDHSSARLFIESCGKQARIIRKLTSRPVLSIEDNALV